MSGSYKDILLTLGATGDEVLFVTDILEEAQAAKDAGLSAVLSVRPGNLQLQDGHTFRTVSSFDELI